MILPLPTVSNIDVTAERLRDVDRDAARPLPDIAGTAVKAIQTGAAVQEMGEQERRRQEADWFQKEYVDKGWEGADKMWKEMGSPSDMNPAYWRTAVGDAPAKYFEALGKKAEEKAAAERRKAFAAGEADPAVKAALESGDLPVKDYIVEGGRDKRSRADIDSREKIAEARNTIERTKIDLKKIEGSGTSGATQAALKVFNDQLKDYGEKIAAIAKKQAAGEFIPEIDGKVLSGLITKSNATQAEINRITAKTGKTGREEAVTPPQDSDSVEEARKAVAAGAPSTKVYDRYREKFGKRHPDDKRK